MMGLEREVCVVLFHLFIIKSDTACCSGTLVKSKRRQSKRVFSWTRLYKLSCKSFTPPPSIFGSYILSWKHCKIRQIPHSTCTQHTLCIGIATNEGMSSYCVGGRLYNREIAHPAGSHHVEGIVTIDRNVGRQTQREMNQREDNECDAGGSRASSRRSIQGYV